MIMTLIVLKVDKILLDFNQINSRHYLIVKNLPIKAMKHSISFNVFSQ